MDCVVVLLIQSKQGSVLTVKQRGGAYSLPKGHIEHKETIQQAAVRELLEETGLRIPIANQPVAMESPYKNTRYHFVRVLSDLEIPPRPRDCGEIERAEWVSVGVIDRMLQLSMFNKVSAMLLKTMV